MFFIKNNLNKAIAVILLAICNIFSLNLVFCSQTMGQESDTLSQAGLKQSEKSATPEPSSTSSPTIPHITESSELDIHLPLKGQDFTLLDGTSYKDTTVKRIEPDGIIILDSNGIRKLQFKNLPLDIQKKYGYDKKVAMLYRQQVFAISQARDKAEMKILQERQKELEESELQKQYIKDCAHLSGTVIQSFSNSSIINLSNTPKKIFVKGLNDKPDGTPVDFYAHRDGIFTITNNSVIQNGVPMTEKMEKWVFIPTDKALSILGPLFSK